MGGDMERKIVSTGVELRTGQRAESIRIRFMYRGVECREAFRLPHTKPNIAYAIRRRGEVINAIERGTFVYGEFFPDSPTAKLFAPPENTVPSAPSRDMTIGALLREYLELAKRNLALSSYNCYRQVAEDHLFPKWDTKPVAELTTRELRNWIMTLEGKRKTVQLILTPLRNTLEHALVDELIETNPFDSIRLNKILSRDQMQSSFRADPFDIDEIEAILNACERQEERNMFQFAFCTGMRPSEYIAQVWSDVNFVMHELHVAGAFVDGEAKASAKTQAGLRTIDMRDGALEALKAQQAHTKLAGDLIFLNPAYRKQWAGDKPIRERWGRILLIAGVRYRNPYQTRHTYASSLLMLGANPLYVATQLGHVDTTLVFRTYGRWISAGMTPEKRQRLLRLYSRTDALAANEFPHFG
jgi:integrase